MAYKRKPLKDDYDALAELAAGLANSSRKPNNLMYKPHAKQLMFHASEKNGRQYIGGNRSGKTTGGINEDIWWLRGVHPYRKVPEPPIIGRITTVDFKNGATKIIIPNLRQWTPPSLLINGSWEDSYNGQTHTLHLSNGSELEIMSYDQDLDKFAGVPRHFIHFDEEPTKDIFDECKARLIDYAGAWWMTMTPVEGMTWTFDEIYEPSNKGQNPLIDIINVAIQDNTYLAPEAIIEYLQGADADGVRIRGTGEYIAIGGLVFKHYDPERHVIESKIPPKEWTHYLSLDAGYNNPTAVYCHAVSPTGEVVTYWEHYKSEMTVAQHAKVILEQERRLRELGIVLFLRVADPAIKQRSAVTGLSVQIEYANCGVPFALGGVRDVNAGLDKMNDYLRTDKWFITESCVNLQKEMRTYKRSQYATSKLREKNNKREEPQKKNDHGCDSCRYFFSFMPELVHDDKEAENTRLDKQRIASLLQAGTVVDLSRPIVNTDTQLSRDVQTEKQYFVQDEYVGEW